MLTDQRQFHLAHQLIVEADAELLGAHFRQWTEMQLAGGADDGVHLADALEHRVDAGAVGQIHQHLAAAAPA